MSFFFFFFLSCSWGTIFFAKGNELPRCCWGSLTWWPFFFSLFLFLSFLMSTFSPLFCSPQLYKNTCGSQQKTHFYSLIERRKKIRMIIVIIVTVINELRGISSEKKGIMTRCTYTHTFTLKEKKRNRKLVSSKRYFSFLPSNIKMLFPLYWTVTLGIILAYYQQ